MKTVISLFFSMLCLVSAGVFAGSTSYRIMLSGPGENFSIYFPTYPTPQGCQTTNYNTSVMEGQCDVPWLLGSTSYLSGYITIKNLNASPDEEEISICGFSIVDTPELFGSTSTLQFDSNTGLCAELNVSPVNSLVTPGIDQTWMISPN